VSTPLGPEAEVLPLLLPDDELLPQAAPSSAATVRTAIIVKRLIVVALH
jgi:hypothetical protein